MAKPILIIGLPNLTDQKQFDEILKYFNSEKELKKEYHLLIYHSNCQKEIKFEVINPNNVEKSSLEEIKNNLEEKFKNLNISIT